MGQRHLLAACLLLVAGVASATAFGAKAGRKGKVGHAAPAPPPKPEAEPAPEPLAPEPMATEAAPAASVTKETAEPAERTSASDTDIALANGASLGDTDYAALGRTEMARRASGRIEVAVLASVGIGSRHFTYSDPVERALAPYHLAAAPMASFALEAYPAASTDLPVLRDLGLRGRLSQAVVVGSQTSQGIELDSSWTRFGGEVRQRIFLPVSRPFELGVFAGADASYFGMSTKTKITAVLPSAHSLSARFGLDTRLLLVGRLSLLASAAYLWTASPGAVYKRFRDPRVQAVDGEVGVGLGVGGGLEAQLTFRYTRYFATFHPVVGDPLAAGGALDQQLQFGLGVRYAH